MTNVIFSKKNSEVRRTVTAAKIGFVCVWSMQLAACANDSARLSRITDLSAGVSRADALVTQSYRVLGDIAEEARFSLESYRMLTSDRNAACEELAENGPSESTKARRAIKGLKDYLRKLGEFRRESESEQIAAELFTFARGLVKAGASVGIVLPGADPTLALGQRFYSAARTAGRAEAARELITKMDPTVARLSNELKSRMAGLEVRANRSILDWEECERAKIKLYVDDQAMTLSQKEARIRQFHTEHLELRKRESVVGDARDVFDEIIKVHSALADPRQYQAADIAQTTANIAKIMELIQQLDELTGRDPG